jgi:hypothetical protein
MTGPKPKALLIGEGTGNRGLDPRLRRREKNVPTDAALEELEQMVEIEEAGYSLVMTTHRQTYIGGIEPGPWEARYHIRQGARRPS